MKVGRTKNTVRNIRAGVIYQIVSIVLPFINRTAILYTLGTEFTGLSGLFTSILHVLNIAELGFNSAIVYSLYQPVAENDTKKINEIVSLLKRVYNIIGLFILIAGLLLMPAIPYLIKGTYPSSINIYYLYLLYLVNSVLSYFLFAYKESLLIANQRKDIADNIRTIINIFRYLIQLIVLIMFRNFYIYLVISIIGTILTNIIIHFSVSKRYKYLNNVNIKTKIPNSIKKQVRGLMVGKIGDTCRNSFDSLIISSFLGLTALTIYGNYYYIYSSLTGIMLVICNSMSASVGNSIVEKSEKENYSNLLTFSQLFAIILCVCTTCLVTLYQPFMKIWVGEKLLLPLIDMFLFCLYFYMVNINNIRNQFISGNGMWDKLKTSYILEAIANLILNILLGKLLGITGVIIATILTIFIFNYLQRNRILFNNYFKSCSIIVFYKEQLYYLLLTIISCLLSYFICNSISSTGIIGFIIYGLLSIFISLLIIIIGLAFTKRFDKTKEMIRRIISLVIKRERQEK